MQLIIENFAFGVIVAIVTLIVVSSIRDTKRHVSKHNQNQRDYSENHSSSCRASSIKSHDSTGASDSKIPQDPQDAPTKFKQNDVAVFKIVAEIQHSNAGKISKGNVDTNGNEVEEIFGVRVIYTSRIEFTQEFDLSSGRQLARLAKNLEQIAEQRDCEMIDHIHQCVINQDDTVYPHYSSEHILDGDGLLCFYNLQEIEYTVLTGEQAGRVIRDDNEEWYFEAAIEGFNIGFEGIGTADEFKSISTHWSNRKNSIAIKTINSSNAKRITKRFGFKNAKQALDYLDQYAKDRVAI